MPLKVSGHNFSSPLRQDCQNHRTWRQKLRYQVHLPHFADMRRTVRSGGDVWTRLLNFQGSSQSIWRALSAEAALRTAEPPSGAALQSTERQGGPGPQWHLPALSLESMSDTKSLLSILGLWICGSNNCLLFRWPKNDILTPNFLEAKVLWLKASWRLSVPHYRSQSTTKQYKGAS